ncbi:response regulator [Aridibaculum aurantiacum]|uniref:response regulator n=1 Tax=Aridibaculum aurantiacum TaxID=2810307 RepID=UPI001A97B2CF|nr:response regulator [Aridibaculum aurantiacum]
MKKPLDILLIEDDVDDVDLLKEALDENSIDYQIEVIMEGDKVSNHIQDSTHLPGIIVMDLNLPKADGKEVLQVLKSNGPFSDVPVIVLTTSSSKEDIDYCYKMGVNKFITKPATIEGWNETISKILDVAGA